jgi:hypothetical protein
VVKKDMHKSLQPLLTTAAPERYKIYLKHVPLDLEVWVCGDNLCGLDPREIELVAARTRKTVIVAFPDSAPPHLRSKPKGDALHISPFTPFTLLHRLGDELGDKLRETKLTDLMYVLTLARTGTTEAPGTLLSAGVDTETGRRSLFVDVGNVRADLFAKYLLTGKIAFDPYALPDPRLQQIRVAWRDALRNEFPRMVQYAIGRVFPI